MRKSDCCLITEKTIPAKARLGWKDGLVPVRSRPVLSGT